MCTKRPSDKTQAGFSLIELFISMTVTVVVMGISGAMIAKTFNIRGRENQKVSALADAQRALNMMTREVANSGYGMTTNGLVAANSNNTRIRFRADLNRDSSIGGGEDVMYMINVSNGRSSLIRVDVGAAAGPTPSVLAERMDGLRVHYYDQRVNYTTSGMAACGDIDDGAATEVTPSQATYIVLAACVTMPAVGSPGAAGYQPASTVQLVSDVNLRNANLSHY